MMLEGREGTWRVCPTHARKRFSKKAGPVMMYIAGTLASPKPRMKAYSSARERERAHRRLRTLVCLYTKHPCTDTSTEFEWAIMSRG